MIKVSNLTRRYGTFTAVDDMSFEIPSGQIVGLLGHNGAGKTTTLKMLTRYLEPSSGVIEVQGKNLEDHFLEIQKLIGYLPENSPLYSDMTIIQYLEYVAKMRGIPEADQAAAIRSAIESTHLKSKAFETISTLSKGYRQRVGVAQAIIHKPKILILDEPTNGLDPTQIDSMRLLIKELSKSATVILSTHIMQEVEAVCDRVLIVMHGRLVVDSKLSELQKENQIKLVCDQSLSTVREGLSGLDGVGDVRLIKDNQTNGSYEFLIASLKDESNLSPQIANKAVQSGWNIYSLYEERKDLETVFKDANRMAGKDQYVQ